LRVRWCRRFWFWVTYDCPFQEMYAEGNGLYWKSGNRLVGSSINVNAIKDLNSDTIYRYP